MRRLAIVTLLVAGCYSPNPPGGAYRCSEGDSACPVGQHCTCGLCVGKDAQAACSFALSLPAGSTAEYDEHEKFALTIQALMQDGKSAASGFNGQVDLSSSWGDVTPANATLANGAATVMVQLNRETVPPQVANVKASFGAATGLSTKITVDPPPFVRDATPIVPPVGVAKPFGPADLVVAQPDVTRIDGQYRMYFLGGAVASGKVGIGTAVSPDGLTFTPAATPILTAGSVPAGADPITSPAFFFGPGHSPSLAFSSGHGIGTGMDFSQGIGVATSTDPASVFQYGNNGNFSVSDMSGCKYCANAVGFPAVVEDPYAPSAVDGGTGGWLMFFSALTDNGITQVVSIGRASSTDGLNFAPEPAAILSSELGSEYVLLSPRVLLDGTVLKMWYTFARLQDLDAAGTTAEKFCSIRSTIGVGYAHASYANATDGLFWVRSPHNPVVAPGGTGWDNDVHAFLVGSVIPLDGSDPASGVALYYSTYRHVGLTCSLNGIGRATRP